MRFFSSHISHAILQGLRLKEIGFLVGVFIAVWLCPVHADAQECGENPMKSVLLIAKKNGQCHLTFLSVLRINDEIKPSEIGFF